MGLRSWGPHSGMSIVTDESQAATPKGRELDSRLPGHQAEGVAPGVCVRRCRVPTGVACACVSSRTGRGLLMRSLDMRHVAPSQCGDPAAPPRPQLGHASGLGPTLPGDTA